MSFIKRIAQNYYFQEKDCCLSEKIFVFIWFGEGSNITKVHFLSK